MMGQKTTTADKAASGALIKRMVLVLSTVLAATLLASGLALAATTTFSNTSAILIPDSGAAGPYPSQINVQNLSETTSDVNLKLSGFSHAFPDDVGVLLEGPQGQKALLMSDVGFNLDVSSVNLTFDDEATNSLPDDDQITTGTFKPTQGTVTSVPGDCATPANFPSPAPAGAYSTDLSVFDGTAPNGTWNLYVIDDCAGDEGRFSGGWSLQITTAPRVLSTTPQAGALNVSPTANVTATFTEAMDASTINGTTFKLVRLNADGTTTRVTAAVSYAAATKKAKLNPASNLSSGQTYKATVTTGAQDVDGNALDQKPNIEGNQSKSWKFTVQ